MATAKLVEEIRRVLCESNHDEPKYASAWLSFNDDLTGRERYVLNVKAEHDIPSCFAETRLINEKLREQLEPEALRLISRIVVHNFDEQVHCWTDDIVVVEEGSVC